MLSVQWISATAAEAEIGNVNPWTDGEASTAYVMAMKCNSSVAVTGAGHFMGVLPKGASRKITVPVPKANADYLQASANGTNSAAELASNKANNVRNSVEFVNNKSCTPH